jgi:hypothetical protein
MSRVIALLLRSLNLRGGRLLYLKNYTSPFELGVSKPGIRKGLISNPLNHY